MADSQRHAADSLIQSLRGKKCCRYDFFRFVRLLQAARRDLPAIGCSTTPTDDPIRFGQRPSLAFPPSTLDELVLDEKDPTKPPKLYVNFMGLFGPNGPLPLHLTEFAIRRHLGHPIDETSERGVIGSRMGDAASAAQAQGSKDDSLADFFDVFHHRFISLFFRAWAVAQPTVDLDRDDFQRFLFFLGAFVGESNADPAGPNLDDNDLISRREKAYYVGRLSCPVRNAEGLEAILTDYFGIPTEAQEFLGRWFNLPAEDQCQLGRPGSAWLLGRNVFVGSRTWAVHLGFRLRMGPMVLEDYLSLLPTGRFFPLLQAWVTNYCGIEMYWDVQLVLRANEVPDTVLGRAGKLGWTTWLRSMPFTRDATVVLNPSPELN
ncbi:MAG TPA: type VI secretion system baseplate subunit TssG [Verrucomicrobiae bacterium]|jgi:type VI secretion system protein ImpH